ncbi:MAG: PAS domain S-box protein [Gemmatimonadetes bacterium]|nr:PAS domain S-box protein [Gemmatimonadota bacterium]
MLPLLLPAPVVVVTGRGEGELGARLLRAGATDFVGKDWLGPGSVTRAVENAIERFAMATELRQRQRALRESESRTRTIFEHATTGIAIIDASGHYLRCNAAYSAITGLSEEELRHREFPALLHAEERERSRAHMQLLLAGAIPSYELDGRFIRQDGSVRWVHKFVSVLDVEDGRPHELISLVTDVTARRAAEAELRERDDAARLVADTAARLVLGNAGGALHRGGAEQHLPRAVPPGGRRLLPPLHPRARRRPAAGLEPGPGPGGAPGGEPGAPRRVPLRPGAGPRHAAGARGAGAGGV